MILRRLTGSIAVLFSVLSTLLMSFQPAFAANLTVNTVGDLVAAINTANSTPATADTIILTANITLTAVVETVALYGATGLPAIVSPITIEGQGHSINRSTVGGTANFRLLRVASGANLSLYNLTLSNGAATAASAGDCNTLGCGGGIYNEGTLLIADSTLTNHTTTGSGGDGGAVLNAGSLTLRNSTLSGNTSGFGAGIYNRGSLNIQDSVFTNNGADSFGAAVFNSSTLTVSNSTIAANSAVQYGGGIYNEFSSTATITGSTFFNNTSTSFGGALFNNNGSLTVSNSTLSGNTSGNGGGVYQAGGNTTISNSTIANNVAMTGAGLSNHSSGVMTVRNSILVKGMTGSNCVDDGTGLTFNASLADDASCTGLSNTATIHLAALANNGGITQTHSLNAGSTALDTANDTNCGATDQRGVMRGIDAAGGINLPQAGDCDMGAFESGGVLRTLEFAAASSSLVGTSTPVFPVTLKLDAPLATGYGPISASVWVSGGTAVAGIDYAPFGMQSVTFNPGDSSKTMTLNLLSTPVTVTRTIILSFATLNGPGFNGPAHLGTVLNHTVTLNVSTANAAPSVDFFTTHTPTLTWTAISNATGYEIQVDSDTKFLAPYSFTPMTVSANTFSLQTPSLPNGVYYWRVRATKTSGVGAWSTPQRFEIGVP